MLIRTLENVECLELCEISSKTQCSRCSKYWAEGIVYCTCGTCLAPTEYTNRWTKEKFDTLSIPYWVSRKGSHHSARCGKTEAQREYRQAKDCLKKAMKQKKARSSNDYNSRIRTENLNNLLDGPKTFADIWTRSRMKMTLNCHVVRVATVRTLP